MNKDEEKITAEYINKIQFRADRQGERRWTASKRWVQNTRFRSPVAGKNPDLLLWLDERNIGIKRKESEINGWKITEMGGE